MSRDVGRVELLRATEPGSRFTHWLPLEGARESVRPPALCGLRPVAREWRLVDDGHACNACHAEACARGAVGT